MIKLNLKNNRQKGFTLLEALVAISILMVAVSAPIAIAQKGLSSAVYSKDQMIASYLAQDALEYIKNKRDEITINDANSDWQDLSLFRQADQSCFSANGCDIDTVLGNIRSFDKGVFLAKDSDSFYGHSGTDIKFTRQVIMKDIFSNEVLVTVTVAWPAGSVIVNTLIFNY